MASFAIDYTRASSFESSLYDPAGDKDNVAVIEISDSEESLLDNLDGNHSSAMVLAPLVSVSDEGVLLNGPLVSSVFHDTLRRVQVQEAAIISRDEELKEKNHVIDQLQARLLALEHEKVMAKEEWERKFEFQNRVIISLDRNIEKALEAKDEWELSCKEAEHRISFQESENARLRENLTKLEAQFHRADSYICTLEDKVCTIQASKKDLSENLLMARRGNMARISPALFKALSLLMKTLWKPTTSPFMPSQDLLIRALGEGLQQVEQLFFFIIRANMISRMITGDFDEGDLVATLGSSRLDIPRVEMHLGPTGQFTYPPGATLPPTAPRVDANIPRGSKRPRIEMEGDMNERD
ncbi:hypothetical protein VNI00_010690 [Paramarasmius palmivorus]|uniref:Uncharacterized protein n=1 Tax=Paramarasmius palmivorus TaxID=297713 RepID=A0AAW0BHX2_9AGAR